MSTNRTPGERIESNSNLAGRIPALCALFLLGFAGCGHKAVKVHIPVVYPVDLESTSSTTDDEIEPVPPPEIAPLQWPEPPRPPIRRRPPPPADASVPQPGNDTAPELNIGTLTTGGDATPQSLQQARDLIGSVDRRATSLPPRIMNSERPQVRQVRNYLDQAKQALNTGDAEGAVNLANKARQLVDELERR